MSRLITITQASVLRDLGFNLEICTRYAYRFDPEGKFQIQKEWRIMRNSDSPKHLLAVPDVDTVIEWLRTKYHVIVYNAVEPFVNPTSKNISFSYKVKYCDLKWGWNQRIRIGQTPWSNDPNAMKRTAIWLAIRYIQKKEKDAARRRNSKNRRRIV